MTGPLPAMRVAIRVDGDFTLGLGHAVRCAGLARALGPAAQIHVWGRGEALGALFAGAPIMAPGAAAPADGYDVVIIDRPGVEPEFWRWARATGAVIVAIDDHGGRAPPADLIVNGAAPPAYHRYEGLAAGARVYAGAAYALVRPEFAAARDRADPRAGVAIVAGSGARAARWVEGLIAGPLPFADWAPVTLVVGASYPDGADLAARCARRGVAFAQGLAGAALAALLGRAAAALTTGGMIVYEGLAAGVPVIAYPQESNLVAEMDFLAAAGCIRSLGPEGGEEPALLRREIEDVLSHPEQARARAARAGALIDGRGIERVAALTRQAWRARRA